MTLLHSILYRGGSPGGLGRSIPADWKHIDRFPLSALPEADQPTGVPVVIGVNWYSDFDTPEKDQSGRWWIAKRGIHGGIRGGHCVCLKSRHQNDPLAWWSFYDQGREGACVGFGSSRCMSLLNRKRYDARWLWDIAKKTDDFPNSNPGDENGTTVRAAMEVLRTQGHVPWQKAFAGRSWQQRDAEKPVGAAGIAAYRWARSVDEVRKALDTPLHDKLQAVAILNSWGRSYPRITWLPYTVLERLIKEDGEVALVTDK